MRPIGPLGSEDFQVNSSIRTPFESSDRLLNVMKSPTLRVMVSLDFVRIAHLVSFGSFQRRDIVVVYVS